jgi:hypothetical protein
MTKAEAIAYFDAYAAAFTRFDIDAICALWVYPALFAGRGKRAVLDAGSFRANTEALCEFYRAQGVARARKRLISLDQLAPTIAAAVTEDELTDDHCAVLAQWRHGYILSETTEGAKAIAAFPDAELDAWEARGARLGSW